MTVADAIATHAPECDSIAATLNGRVLPADLFVSTMLKPGDYLLLVPRIESGGSGKQILNSILMIGITVASYGILGPGAAALGIPGLSLTGAWLVGGVALCALAGGLVLSALTPPPSTSRGASGASQMYSWNPQTVQQQGLAVPMWYGLNKLSGNVVMTYTETAVDGKKQTLTAIVALGRGPIKSVQNIKINDQPLSTYSDIAASTATGLLDQSAPTGFDKSKSETAVYHTVSSGAAYVWQVPQGPYDQLEIDVGFPQGLYHMNDKGSLLSYAVKVRAEYRQIGAQNWTVLNSQETDNTVHTVTDKSSSNVRRTLPTITRQGGADYEIRITKLTPDRLSKTGDKNFRYGQELQLLAVRQVVNQAFQYPRLAYAAIQAIATQDISGGLQFSCEIEGRNVRTWDGTHWGVQYSTNPAWVLLDILTQPVFSGSVAYAPAATPPSNAFTVQRFDGIDPSRLDMPTFLELAQYCDQVVADSTKRATFNGGFDSDATMWESVLKVCEIARCVPVWNGTQLTLAIDKAGDPVQMFTVGNITSGTFHELFIPQNERATEIEVTYRDADQDWEQTTFTIIDEGRPTSQYKVAMDMVGVTSAKEAYRHGLYRLNQNRLLRRTIEFAADVDAIACTIGDIVLVQHDVPEWGCGGRVVAATANTVTLDVVPDFDQTSHEVLVRLTNDALVSRDVASVDGAVVTVTENFPSIPHRGNIYAFGKSNTATRPYRVVGLEKNSDQSVNIQAIEYNASVYDCDTPGSEVTPITPIPPVNLAVQDLTVSELVGMTENGAIGRYIFISWRIPHSSAWDHAEIYVQIAGLTSWEKIGESRFNEYRWLSVEPSTTYTIKVISVDTAGRRRSFSASPTVQITTGSASGATNDYLQARITGLQLYGQGNGATFTARDARFVWNDITAYDQVEGAGSETSGAGNTSPNTWLRDYEVKILDSSGSLRRMSYVSTPDFTYGYEQNCEDGSGTPIRAFAIEVRARDRYYNRSRQPARLAVSNPAPAVPANITVTGLMLAFRVKWDLVADNDLAGYIVWASQTANFTPGTANRLYTGPNPLLNYTVATSGDYYVRVAAYDAFGEDGIIISDQHQVSVTAVPLGQLSGYNLNVPFLEGVVFTVSGTTTSWTAGTINYAGAAYAIAAGSTTDLYVYYDFLASGPPTVLSHSAAAPTIGKSPTSDAWLLCVREASGKINVAAMNLLIHAGLIQASAITADKLAVVSLSAIAAALGTITSGSITLDLDQDGNKMRMDENGIYGSSDNGSTWKAIVSLIDGRVTFRTDSYEIGQELVGMAAKTIVNQASAQDHTDTETVNSSTAYSDLGSLFTVASAPKTLTGVFTFTVSSGTVTTCKLSLLRPCAYVQTLDTNYPFDPLGYREVTGQIDGASTELTVGSGHGFVPGDSVYISTTPGNFWPLTAVTAVSSTTITVARDCTGYTVNHVSGEGGVTKEWTFPGSFVAGSYQRTIAYEIPFEGDWKFRKQLKTTSGTAGVVMRIDAETGDVVMAPIVRI